MVIDMKKKGSWLKVAAILAAVIGGIVAIAAFMKKKGKKIREELDFDDERYFDEEEDDFTDDIMDGDETIEPYEHFDETAPDEAADNIDIPVTEKDAEEDADDDSADGDLSAPKEE